jgi:hypothetical protein
MAGRKKKKKLRLERGRELTPRRERELVREAERGYDLSTARTVYVGRPSLSGNGTSPKMSFRITPELYLALERKAERESKSVSAATREAIARYVDS